MVERGLCHTVTDETGLDRYLPAVRGFLDFAEARNLMVITWEEKDMAMAAYLGTLMYKKDGGPSAGDLALNGFIYVWPAAGGRLPTSWRIMKGWHKTHVKGEGQPMAYEAAVAVGHTMRGLGFVEEADCLDVALDGYLREQDLFQLRVEDIVEERSGLATVLLGVPERGESTKTGRQQGVRLDTVHASNILLQRKAAMREGELVFTTNPVRYRQAIDKSCQKLGIATPPAHSIRHTGPSRDAFEAYRTMAQIKRRGRWNADGSLLRYAKTHAYATVLANMPTNVMTLGQQLLCLRVDRAASAQE
jgi:hypothetical protein